VNRLKKSRHPLVVCVEKRDEISLALSHSTISSGSRPGVLLSNDSKTFVGNCADKVQAAICRSVVHDDDFKLPHRLGEDRIQTAADVFLFVV
jgi:hypothetical protein